MRSTSDLKIIVLLLFSIADLLIFRNSGFSTLGEIDSVLFVGPIAPATYFCFPLILVASSAALFAIIADS